MDRISAVGVPNTTAIRGSRRRHTCFRWVDEAGCMSCLEADSRSRSSSLPTGSSALGRPRAARREIHRESPGTHRLRSLHTSQIVVSLGRDNAHIHRVADTNPSTMLASCPVCMPTTACSIAMRQAKNTAYAKMSGSRRRPSGSRRRPFASRRAHTTCNCNRVCAEFSRSRAARQTKYRRHAGMRLRKTIPVVTRDSVPSRCSLFWHDWNSSISAKSTS